MDEDLLFCGAVTGDDELIFMAALETEMKQTQSMTYLKNFNIDNLSDDECETFFRFKKDDIPMLKDALNIPHKVVCENGTTCSGIEGLCILLRRLTYPNRLKDMSKIFERPHTEISHIVNCVLHMIYDKYSHKLTSLNQTWLNSAALEEFARAVNENGGPIANCWGFIDGTCRPICRPTVHQKIVYSGHKRCHVLKFQAVTTPHGLIANLFGPIEGRRHDAGILRLSGLLGELDTMKDTAGNNMCIYGDAAYPLNKCLMTPFKGVITDEEKLFNKRMSKVRVTVEWSFGKIISLFAFLDFKKNNKLLLQPVGKYYVVGTLLCNCHTCLYGSETAAFFSLTPPDLEYYLNG